jgi:hypothetical protein
MQTRLWWRLWWGLAESAFGGSLESGGPFCVRTFGRDVVSVAVKMFTDIFYEFCTFNAICKDNAAINCLLLNTKEVHSCQL